MQKILEKQIKKMLKKDPEKPELLVLIDKWFWITEKQNRMAQRFVSSFMSKHLKQTDKEFIEWLTK